LRDLEFLFAIPPCGTIFGEVLLNRQGAKDPITIYRSYGAGAKKS